jgi:competence protein ComGC
MQAVEAYQALIWVLIIGIGVFAVFILLMVVFFGVATSTFGKHKTGLVALFLFSLLTPLFVVNMQQHTQSAVKAQNEATITKSTIIATSKNTYELRFETNEAAIGTMEILKNGITTAVLPAYSLQPRIQHFIQLDKDQIVNAEIFILLNGKKYPFKLEGKYN